VFVFCRNLLVLCPCGEAGGGPALARGRNTLPALLLLLLVLLSDLTELGVVIGGVGRVFCALVGCGLVKCYGDAA